MMFSYACFGLCLHSDIPFPHAVPSECPQADIIIHAGDVPTGLEGAAHQGALYQLTSTALLYHLPGIARFWLKDGREIIYEAFANTDTDTIRSFLMSTLLPLLFHQRHEMPVCGCAVEIDGEVVILTGYSGAGKSTLAAALHQRGYRVLADEFSVVRYDADSKRALVYPSFACLHLWSFALQKLNYSQEAIATMPRLRPVLEKYALDVREDFQLTPAPLRAIYIMNAPARQVEPLVALTPEQSLLNVNWILSYQRLAIEMGSIKHYWGLAGHLIKDVGFWYLSRARWAFNFDELVRLVKQGIDA